MEHPQIKDENFDALRQMFPDMMVEIIQEALSLAQGDVDAALETLLAIQASLKPEEEKSGEKSAPSVSLNDRMCVSQPKPILPMPMPIVERPQPAPPPSLEDVATRVALMVDNKASQDMAGMHGMSIQNICYEDPGRSKFSVMGPCISDMTLVVNQRLLPVVRYPNYEDLSWDIRIEDVVLPVGNARGRPLTTVSLREYLNHFSDYLSTPPSGGRINLLAPRDTHVLASAQACFLPVEQGQKTEFNVALKNYQSSPGAPAVLCIVVSHQGTSAQVITSAASDFQGQLLYHNANGRRASFVAQRLTDERAARGVSMVGDMTEAESQANTLMIIQVPLRQNAHYKRAVNRGANHKRKQPSAPSYHHAAFSRMDYGAAAEAQLCDVEDAMLEIGASSGMFDELDGCAMLQRDQRFPVRITVQMYKCTTNGAVDTEVFRRISDQLSEEVNRARFVGSLVVNPSPHRPTESKEIELYIPAFWGAFWNTYGCTLKPYSRLQAEARLFSTPRFIGRPQKECEDEIFRELLPGKPPSSGGAGGVLPPVNR